MSSGFLTLLYNDDNNKQLNIIESKLRYLQDTDTEHIFVNGLLEINFKLYKSIGNLYFKNNTFKCGSRKIEIIFNITYTWVNVEYAPRFNFNIMKNDQIYYTTYRGLSDTMTQNTIFMSVIVDIKQNDKLSFIFEKTSLSDGDKFIIADNSYYIVKTF